MSLEGMSGGGSGNVDVEIIDLKIAGELRRGEFSGEIAVKGGASVEDDGK